MKIKLYALYEFWFLNTQYKNIKYTYYSHKFMAAKWTGCLKMWIVSTVIFFGRDGIGSKKKYQRTVFPLITYVTTSYLSELRPISFSFLCPDPTIGEITENNWRKIIIVKLSYIKSNNVIPEV